MTAILAAIAWYGGLIGTSRGGFVEAMLLRLERGTPNSAAANTKQCPLDHPEHLHPALNSGCSASHSTSSCIKLGGSLPASRYIRTKTLFSGGEAIILLTAVRRVRSPTPSHRTVSSGSYLKFFMIVSTGSHDPSARRSESETEVARQSLSAVAGSR